jgi:hypothetical protein
MALAEKPSLKNHGHFSPSASVDGKTFLSRLNIPKPGWKRLH